MPLCRLSLIVLVFSLPHASLLVGSLAHRRSATPPHAHPHSCTVRAPLSPCIQLRVGSRDGVGQDRTGQEETREERGQRDEAGEATELSRGPSGLSLPPRSSDQRNGEGALTGRNAAEAAGRGERRDETRTQLQQRAQPARRESRRGRAAAE